MRNNSRRLLLPVSIGLLLPALHGCSKIVGLNKLSINTAGAAGSEIADGGESANGGETASGGVTAGGKSNPGTSRTSAGGKSSIGGESSVGGGTVIGCASNAECTATATAASGVGGASATTGTASTVVPAVCERSTGKCVPLLSEDCSAVTGDYLSDQAIVIGSLFQTLGTTATQNIPRQQSAQLAIEEVNASGGIPSTKAGVSRPLVMVSCNASTDLTRAANHLVVSLKVPAIVGPNTSQDTIDVSNKVTIQAGVAVLSPSAVAASIADLIDNDLTWLMIPSDDQRAQLMIKQITDLEVSLKAVRSVSTIKLSIIYRNDALGIGTRTSLDKLQLNGKALSDPSNAGNASGNVHIVPYDYKQADQSAIVTKEVAFAPDIVVLAGTAESITKVMTPIEQQWTAGANRPYYLIIDPSKGPELLSAVTGNDALRLRVRGTGTTPAAASATVANAFNLDYVARYGTYPTASGTGTSYDAAYAIAYALAATKDETPTGASVAKGLRQLASGTVAIDTGTQDLLAAFQNLAAGKAVTVTGTSCPLDWDANGTVKGGTIEMWCIGKTGETPLFQSSGLSFDIKTQTYSGAYVQCGT